MKLLATDLDGTLLYPNRYRTCMPKKNAKFLHKWINEGNKVVCVSSRSLSFKLLLEEEVGFPLDFIGASSAQMSFEGKVIKDESLINKEIIEIVNELEEKYHPFAFIAVTKSHPFIIKTTHKKSKVLATFYRTYWKAQGKKAERYLLDATSFDKALKEDKVYKVMIFFGLKRKNKAYSKDASKEIREKYPAIETSWSRIVIELTPLNCNKAAGLKEYCKLTNTNPSDVYVVGDSGNDISMFKEFHEHSYCLAHGHPSARKYAKHVIRRVYNLDKLVLKGDN